MRNFRNYTCTFYQKNIYELTTDSNDNFVLYYYGDKSPDESFKIIPQSLDKKFKKTVANPSEITNAFLVLTYAIYKGHVFQLEKEINGIFTLSTGDKDTYDTLNIELIDRGWYQVNVTKNEIEKAWEERKTSAYNLPMPSEIDSISEINL